MNMAGERCRTREVDDRGCLAMGTQIARRINNLQFKHTFSRVQREECRLHGLYR